MADRETEEKKRQLLIELEALATKLNFPANRRTDYRWLSHRAMIAGVIHPDYQRLIKIVQQLALLNHDCFLGIPQIGV